MFTTESPTTIEEKLSSGLKKIENMHASVTEYPIHSIDMECEIGHYHEYYGVEYFAQHGLDAKSSPVKILQWMKQNNIDFHPHFNDSKIFVKRSLRSKICKPLLLLMKQSWQFINDFMTKRNPRDMIFHILSKLPLMVTYDT